VSDTSYSSGPVVWQPTREVIENANLTRFMRAHGIQDFNTLLRRSTDDVAWFTDAIFLLRHRFFQPYGRLSICRSIWAEWCVGGK
jgi:acetyl-CoA synthetase